MLTKGVTMAKKITIEMLRKFLHYDEITGKLTWVYHQRNKCLIGREVGTLCKTTGYLQVSINEHRMDAHRLAWMWVYNEIPEMIDHINGIRTDNRICNLRNTTYRGNAQNKICHREGGLVGAYFHNEAGRWGSCISIDGKSVHLGLYETEEGAHKAYLKALENPKSIKTMKESRAELGIPPGIHFNTNSGKWRIVLYKNRKSKCHGYFSTLEEAKDHYYKIKEGSKIV